jgi:hypothetical protein
MHRNTKMGWRNEFQQIQYASTIYYHKIHRYRKIYTKWAMVSFKVIENEFQSKDGKHEVSHDVTPVDLARVPVMPHLVGEVVRLKTYGGSIRLQAAGTHVDFAVARWGACALEIGQVVALISLIFPIARSQLLVYIMSRVKTANQSTIRKIYKDLICQRKHSTIQGTSQCQTP